MMASQKEATLNTAGWRLDNSYAQLPELFYTRRNPEPVRAPQMAVFNHGLAEALGLKADVLDGPDGAAYFAGNQIPDGADPIAQAYAGHQFGHFTMLGDGRAILLGEQITPTGERFDIQLKGSGRTSFSRGGDGRAVLGPMLREYIISEAMHWLGIPTTRSLAVVSTGETVYREGPMPGAILTRVAASHIRIGTFQYARAFGGNEFVDTLADYTLHRHYPELANAEHPYLAMFEAVMDRQAKLVAQWLKVGFIHGVMNTDNMALSGESIDFGPCAFMDTYDPATVFSSIDHHGRYAYGNQPAIAQWNLARLIETLLPLLDAEPEKALELGQAAIEKFPDLYQRHWLSGMRAKLGLFNEEDEDTSLIQTLLSWMHQNQRDYTNTFRKLSSDKLAEEAFFQEVDFSQFYAQWQARLKRQPQSLEEALCLMRAHNPSVIPRNHKVEEALQAAEQGDYSVMHRLLMALEKPYEDLPGLDDYRLPPKPGGRPYQTFCGT
jgi:uncharacterized protein YdiU (UPF0061 family)